MKFISLEVCNWLAYKGLQKIEWPQDDHANILVLFGENMNGKSSILNAIRWALYGEALDRQKRIIPEFTILNNEARTEGEKKYYVILKLEWDGSVYEIKRTANVNESNVTKSLELKKDGRVQDGGVSQDLIEIMVPNQISQFVLFDGELLNEFEELVSNEGSSQANAIKNNIEKALGLPVLQRAYGEIDKLNKTLAKKYSKELQQSNVMESLVRSLQLLENKQESKEKEKNTLLELIEENRIKISEIDEKIEKSSKNIELSEEKKLITQEQLGNKQKLEANKDKLKKHMADIWRQPLYNALQPLVKKLNREIEDLRGQNQELLINKKRVLNLKQAIQSNSCFECGASLSLEKTKEMNETLNQIASEQDNYEQNEGQIQKLQMEVNGIKMEAKDAVLYAEASKYMEIDQDLTKRNIDIENRLFEIRDELSNYDEAEGRRLKVEYDRRKTEIGSLGTKVEILDEEVRNIENEILQIKNSPTFKTSQVDDQTKRASDLTDSLRKIFDAARNEYRSRMRELVQDRASETFSHLTTEPDFDKLEINQSYGLSLVVQGQKVMRSAGAEQIVALSLIESLNHHGRQKGPMIMDTPAGRLDNSHRKKVMEYLPGVVTQLSVFAHSGEMNEDTIYFDRSRIGKKYRIDRKNSFHSELIEI